MKYHFKELESREQYLDLTDERETVVAEVRTCLKRSKRKTLLDIGAGDAKLAQMLQDLVKRYLAIESDADKATMLRLQGIPIVEDRFPCSVEGMFDLILASHSMPSNMEEHGEFLRASNKLLKPKGTFLGAIYDPLQADLSALVESCGLQNPKFDNHWLAPFLVSFKQIGSVSVKTITTYLRSKDVTDILSALMMVYSFGNQDEERKSKFQENSLLVAGYLGSRHFKNGVFTFPIHQVFIQAAKPGGRLFFLTFFNFRYKRDLTLPFLAVLALLQTTN